ncbi:MAG: glycosyltransferase, partial [Bacteroidetes bacterium]|nr:glycosyltransferase [Bacteroidota bacterium]
MAEPLVSIIIPVYNSAPYLDETIRSAMNQTWPNKEIIVVDDGSTDGSLSIARQFETGNVRVFSQPNKGGSSARNKGLREAKGEYIQFLDGDDLLSPDKIAGQMALINGSTDQLAICYTQNFYAEDGPPPSADLGHHRIRNYDNPAKFITDMYYNAGIEDDHRGVVAVHSWLSPRQILDKSGPWDEELTTDDDGEYFCRVMLAAGSIVYVPGVINYYRRYRSGSNLSAKNDDRSMRSRLRAAELKYEHLKAAAAGSAADRAMAKVFKEMAVSFYPEHRYLYLIAMKHVKEAGGSDFVPRLGGPVTEMIKILFGWRAAKLMNYRFRKIFR